MGYTGLIENSTEILERDKHKEIYRYMKGYILQVNHEEVGW